MSKAPFGWTVVRWSVRACGFLVYRRDCPAADAEHFAADLALFTFQTKEQAEEAGRQGYYAYKPAT